MCEEVTLQSSDEGDLQKKYNDLTLPSQYDYLLTQEKLAAEIRKQNKELKAQSEILKKNQEQLSRLSSDCNAMQNQFSQFYHEFESSTEEASEPIENRSFVDDVLIQMIDSIQHLAAATHETTDKLSALLPTSSGFWRRSPPPWRSNAEQLIESYMGGVDTIHAKLLNLLNDLGIELVIPEVNSPFSPHLHRAVEQIEGEGPSRSIAKVVRYGIKKNGVYLRFADVSVFK